MPCSGRTTAASLFDEGGYPSILFRPAVKSPGSLAATPTDGEPNLGVLGVSRLRERARASGVG
jgi:hypothetical protein